MSNRLASNILEGIYQRLMAEYGPQRWWPGETPFEVIIGAILTQSTAWTNVEKAINNLKTAGVMSPSGILEIPVAELALLIKPSGYYNAKAKKLKAFVHYLGAYHNNNLNRMLTLETSTLRQELLTVYGIGEETADSIILYAAGKPVFVIDAYTKRIISRIGLLPADGEYGVYQKYFTDNLNTDVNLFNEYHALLVNLGKSVCRKIPVCFKCCLYDMCRNYSCAVAQLPGA